MRTSADEAAMPGIGVSVRPRLVVAPQARVAVPSEARVAGPSEAAVPGGAVTLAGPADAAAATLLEYVDLGVTTLFLHGGDPAQSRVLIRLVRAALAHARYTVPVAAAHTTLRTA
jgi:hypothetical protein